MRVERLRIDGYCGVDSRQGIDCGVTADRQHMISVICLVKCYEHTAWCAMSVRGLRTAEVRLLYGDRSL